MNSYYLNILNQLGYHVINPNQVDPRICMKSMNKEIKKVVTSNFINFSDQDFEVTYYKDKNSFLFTVSGCFINAGESHDANLTYNVKLSSADIEITFSIMEEPMEKPESIPGLIQISIEYFNSSNEKESSNIKIEQHAIYGVNHIYDRKGIYSNRIEASECTTEKYIQWILEAINKYDRISKDCKIQKGLKIIVPSLTLAIGDMLNYCKTYALTNEIVLRKMNIKDQEEDIKIANAIILDEQHAIEALEEQRHLYAIENQSGSKRKNK